MSANVFYDTNIVLYLLSSEERKADRAEELLALGGKISVQVLNEFSAVSRRKFNLSWQEIEEVLQQVQVVCPVLDLTPQTHARALYLAQRYQFSFYDASIVSAALLAGCHTLYSEDMQNGLVVEQKLTISNPF